MGWHVFQRTHIAFAARTAFQMQANLTRALIPNAPGALRQTYDTAAANVVLAINGGGNGDAALVFHPDANDILDYFTRNLARMRRPGVVLPTAAAMTNNAAAVQGAQQALVQLTFLTAAGNLTQHYP